MLDTLQNRLGDTLMLRECWAVVRTQTVVSLEN